MSNKTHNAIYRRLAITTTAFALLGFGAIATGVQAAAAPGITQADTKPLILAETQGMDRRQDRREDRRDDRQDRRDTRQDCRGEEGAVGKDKRDCKQEGRQERNKDG